MDPQALVARARALFTAHRPAVLLSGAGVAAVLGYRHYQSAGGSAGAAAASPAAADAADGATIAGYNPAGATGAAAYDSSATDIYNALQPQIEQTQSMLEKLLNTPAKTITKIVRVPGPKAKPPKRRPPKKRHPKAKKPRRRRPIPRDKKPGRPVPTKRPHNLSNPPAKAKRPTHHRPAPAPHKAGHKRPPAGSIATRRGATIQTAFRPGHAPIPRDKPVPRGTPRPRIRGA